MLRDLCQFVINFIPVVLIKSGWMLALASFLPPMCRRSFQLTVRKLTTSRLKSENCFPTKFFEALQSGDPNGSETLIDGFAKGLVGFRQLRIVLRHHPFALVKNIPGIFLLFLLYSWPVKVKVRF